MSKISYTNLKLKTDNSVNTFDFNGNQVEILKYLPIEDKYDLIHITLQKAKTGNVFDPLKLDMYFHLNLVYLYTNVTFTEKQKQDEEKIYDTLKSNGFIDALVENIQEEEYNELMEFITETINYELTYKNSAAATIQSVISDLPRNAEAAAAIVNSFDKTKYEEVIKFAEAANGGRPITNFLPKGN